MNLDDMKERATVRLSEMDRDIETSEAALQEKRRQRQRHQKFIEWLGAGDNALVAELAAMASAAAVQRPVKPQTRAPATVHEFRSITPAAATVARQILAEFERTRSGSVASAEKEKLLSIAGSATKLRQLLAAIQHEGIFTVTSSYSAEDRDLTFVAYSTMAEAAE